MAKHTTGLCSGCTNVPVLKPEEVFFPLFLSWKLLLNLCPTDCNGPSMYSETDLELVVGWDDHTAKP